MEKDKEKLYERLQYGRRATVKMFTNILYFVIGILVPYGAEQYAYVKLMAPNDKKTNNSQSYGWRIIWDIAHFLMLVCVGYRIIVVNDALSPWEWLGYFGFLFGVLLRILSLKELGQFYDTGFTIKTDHQIIQSGPYRFLRHPLQLGTLLQIGGMACFAPAWLGIPAVVISLVLCLYSNRTEDHLHAERFGAAFKPYYLKTWDIVDLIFWKLNKHNDLSQ